MENVTYKLNAKAAFNLFRKIITIFLKFEKKLFILNDEVHEEGFQIKKFCTLKNVAKSYVAIQKTAQLKNLMH